MTRRDRLSGDSPRLPAPAVQGGSSPPLHGDRHAHAPRLAHPSRRRRGRACARRPPRAVGSLVDLQIVDRSRGETLSTWRHRGASYVAGRPGDRYARAADEPHRAAACSSSSRSTASTPSAARPRPSPRPATCSRPTQSAEITGWRKSYAEAAAFYFTALPDSYAARTGRPDNVGVIGAAVFRERVPEPLARLAVEPAPPVAERRDGAARSEPHGGRAPGAVGGAAADAAAPLQDAARRCAIASSPRATRRSSAPATASANTRRPRRPPSSARRRAGRDRAGALRQLRQPGRERRHRVRGRAAPAAFPSFVPDGLRASCAASAPDGRTLPGVIAARRALRCREALDDAAQRAPDALRRHRHLQRLGVAAEAGAASASTTALTTAGVAPIVPSSPTPLTPSGLVWHGIEVSNSVVKATPSRRRAASRSP